MNPIKVVALVFAGMLFGALNKCQPVSANNDAWSPSDVGRLIRAVEAMKCR